MGCIAATKRLVQLLTTEQIWTTSATWEITVKKCSTLEHQVVDMCRAL